MIALLITLALAQEPEIVNDDLQLIDIEFVDKVESELNDEIDMPKIQSINELAFVEQK
jgi:hypothetical protein